MNRLPLSLDWEDWYQLCCPPYDAADAHLRYEDRLAHATDLALGLCEELGAVATWFCLADQAARHPELLRRIVAAGHRIGLHGPDHARAFAFGRAAFGARTRDGKARLEDLAGAPVQGFRAPEWSLRGAAETYWQDLPELGFTFDSSRAPLPVLGDPVWSTRPHRLSPGFWELPPATMDFIKWRAPLWGWGMRILPRPSLRRALLALAAEDAGTPLVLHPWELDEAQPPLPVATRGHRFAHSAGLKGYGARLRSLWRGIPLVSLEDWVASVEDQA